MTLDPKVLEAAKDALWHNSPLGSQIDLASAIQAAFDAADLVERREANRLLIRSETERDEARLARDELHAAQHREYLQVKALQAQMAALRAVLADWENTPGNRRSAKWWHEWEDSRRAALTDTAAAAAQWVRVPEGYVVVPVEPTKAMLTDGAGGRIVWDGMSARTVWEAMLAAYTESPK